MTLAETKEVIRHAKRNGIRADYKYKEVFEWTVVIWEEEFTSKKAAIKYIDKVSGN